MELAALNPNIQLEVYFNFVHVVQRDVELGVSTCCFYRSESMSVPWRNSLLQSLDKNSKVPFSKVCFQRSSNDSLLSSTDMPLVQLFLMVYDKCSTEIAGLHSIDCGFLHCSFINWQL